MYSEIQESSLHKLLDHNADGSFSENSGPTVLCNFNRGYDNKHMHSHKTEEQVNDAPFTFNPLRINYLPCDIGHADKSLFYTPPKLESSHST